jgi:hypothetical protein
LPHDPPQIKQLETVAVSQFMESCRSTERSGHCDRIFDQIAERVVREFRAMGNTRFRDESAAACDGADTLRVADPNNIASPKNHGATHPSKVEEELTV